MKEAFIISTDSTSDFFVNEIKEMNLYVEQLDFTITENGQIEELKDNFTTYEQYVEFYERLSNGGVAKTSILNLQAHIDLFTRMAEDGIINAIHITQGMGLSPTLVNAQKAIEEVKQKYPKINYVAIESNTTTASEGNLVKIGLKLRDQGKSMRDTIKILEELKHQTQHFIVVNDLMYLKRGGRIGATSAALGSLLHLKPIIQFDKEGKLKVVRKESGIKKAFKSIISEIKENYTFHKEFGTPIIVHTNNETNAEILANMFEESFNIRPEIRIMGPVIGAHVGPGAVAITFLSNERRKY